MSPAQRGRSSRNRESRSRLHGADLALTQMMEKEAGLEPGALGPGSDIDYQELLLPKHAQQEPIESNKTPLQDQSNKLKE